MHQLAYAYLRWFALLLLGSVGQIIARRIVTDDSIHSHMKARISQQLERHGAQFVNEAFALELP